MKVLFETSAGYAVFQLLEEGKLKEVDNLYKSFETPEAAASLIKLKHFQKFEDTTEALAATTASVEGKLSKTLKKVLKKYVDKDVQDKLLVADAKLGNAIKEKFDLPCVSNTAVNELMRCIRSQLESLIGGLPKKELTAMNLGLAHSLSRYKLKFSPDKIDIMVVQAVSLLDELDKQLNNYIMRCREWYGWHFPELGKIITDNLVFVRVIKVIGTRENAASSDLSDILPEDVEEKVKEAAETSMGTEIAKEDMMNIHVLCDQIIDLSNYRSELNDYLKARMMAIAPNLSVLIGDLVGARLIAQAGSLMNLAKHPASTVQILGAEKALFRALKTKKDTPKYGLIYHSALIGQASTRNKGKMSRKLAAKASLAIRFDAFGEDEGDFTLGAQHKAKLEAVLRLLEEGNNKRISGTAKAKAKFEKYQGISEVQQYPAAADSTLPSLKRKRSDSENVKEEDSSEFTPKQKKKFKKEVADGDDLQGNGLESEEAGPSSSKKKKKVKQEVDVEVKQELEVKYETPEPTSEKKKKKKKRSLGEVEANDLTETGQSSEKKKKKKHAEETEATEEVVATPTSEKKKKKKKQREFE